MISIIQKDNKYQVRFPYDEILVTVIKEVPGKVWHPEGKYWTLPLDKLGFFTEKLKYTDYFNQINITSEEHLGENETLDATPQEDIPEVHTSYTYRVVKGSQPFPHQIDMLNFAIARQLNGHKAGFILADQPGLGKTLQTTNLAIYGKEFNGYKHCLIFCCVGGAKYNWKEDIEKHTNGEFSAYILGSRKKRDGSYRIANGKERLEDLLIGHMYGKEDAPELPYFIITNIETIRIKEGKRYAFADKVIDMINNKEIGMIAIDEIHRNTSPSSSQGKQLLRIKKSISQDIEWIPITGTPIVNKPIDVFLPLRLVDGHYTNSYYNWCQEFCVYGGFGGHQIIGYKNINHLKELLQNNMLRRLKDEVLKLPPKIHHVEYIENTPYQKSLYQKFQKELEEHKADILKQSNPMTMFLKLRYVNGAPELVDDTCQIDDDYPNKNGKIHRVIELIDDIISNNEKVVVFSNWLAPLRSLYTILQKNKYKACVYTGTMDANLREQHKYAFKTNPDYHILLGTVGALGTSHNLEEATNVIFLDEPWTAATKLQCEDRCHRATSKNTIDVYTIITKNTVDDKVHDIIYKKAGISGYIVDDSLDLKNHPEIFKLLLSTDNKREVERKETMEEWKAEEDE